VSRLIFYAAAFLYVVSNTASAQSSSVAKLHPKILVLSEDKGHHVEYSMKAKQWLNHLASGNSFDITYINQTELIDSAFLSHYQLFIQLDFPPYMWSDKSKKAFEAYIDNGWGGWIGFHHATLLGEFDGYPMWNWFSDFMGGIRWKNYIAGFASAKVNLEDADHPVVKGLPKSFLISKDEWYTYDKSPRPNVHVIAAVDEASYLPPSDIKMGDHPVIWSNPSVKARNVYIFMGHSPVLFDDKNYVRLFKNAIFWGLGKEVDGKTVNGKR
jgi:hypothetical protein